MTQDMILVICSEIHFLHFIVLIFIFSSWFGLCAPYNLKNGGTVSNFPYSRIDLKPYQWRYISVDLPQWFSSMTLSLDSNVDLNIQRLEKIKKGRLPVICLRHGGPPLTDVNNDISSLVFKPLSNVSSGDLQALEKEGLCYPMQKHIFLKLTIEQILPGVWYFGFFNGIGPTRTQAKMIDRGKVYSFIANIRIEQCHSLTLGGPTCERTINHLKCTNRHFLNKNLSNSISDEKMEHVITSCDFEGTTCLTNGETKIYALEVQERTKELIVEVKKVKFEGMEVYLKCYARYGAIPSANFHDISANISDSKLTILFPKFGWWYFSIDLVSILNKNEGNRDTNRRICFSFDCQIFRCPQGKAGSNCAFNIYKLQKFPEKEPSTYFEANYKPATGKISSHSAEFPLDPFFANEKSEFSWTYFDLIVPSGASGRNLHVKLLSQDSKISYQVYARHKGMPSLGNWDYFYANSTSNCHDLMSFKLYDSSEEMVSFYILYAREGAWTIGFRRLNSVKNISKNQTMVLISIEGCPNGCAPHGTCNATYDINGSLEYTYCHCDEDHGGFDCSVTIVSRLGRFLKQEVVNKHAGHIWHSIFLVSSNAAALLPAVWCLRQKAYAEWVVFMSSSVSSGIYHACDAGNPCLLSSNVLQFMDFWLSFMAAVSTLVYLTNFGEATKRAINVGVAIITALMARNGATKAKHIAIVIAIGASGLLIGLLIEFGIRFWSNSFSSQFCVDVIERWRTVKKWLCHLVKTFTKRFYWGFLIAAFTSLAMAAFCWGYENPENYWIWHSLWHITIYTSSFLFLRSKAMPVDDELTQQHPTPIEG